MLRGHLNVYALFNKYEFQRVSLMEGLLAVRYPYHLSAHTVSVPVLVHNHSTRHDSIAGWVIYCFVLLLAYNHLFRVDDFRRVKSSPEVEGEQTEKECDYGNP